MAAHRLLLLDGLARRRLALQMALVRRGWIVSAVDTVADALAVLRQGAEPCCLLLSLEPALPDGSGEVALERSVAMGNRTRLLVSPGRAASIQIMSISECISGGILPRPVSLAEVWSDPCPVCEGRGWRGGPPGLDPGKPRISFDD